MVAENNIQLILVMKIVICNVKSNNNSNNNNIIIINIIL
jgi:hypothetical protein